MKKPPSWDLVCLLLGALLLGLLSPFYALYWGPLVLLVAIPAGLLVDLALREMRGH